MIAETDELQTRELIRPLWQWNTLAICAAIRYRSSLLAQQTEHLQRQFRNAEMVKAFLASSEYRQRFGV
jgi:hypothetical protein